MKDHATQADAIAKKLEEQMSKLSVGDSGFGKLKTELAELLSKGAGGGSMNEADRMFFKDLNNETKVAVKEAKDEILKASDESKSGKWVAETFLNKCSFRFLKNSRPSQGVQRSVRRCLCLSF